MVNLASNHDRAIYSELISYEVIRDSKPKYRVQLAKFTL